jgi:hypothetical protein
MQRTWDNHDFQWISFFDEIIFKLAKLMMDAWYVFNSICEICGHFQSIHVNHGLFNYFPYFVEIFLLVVSWPISIDRWIPIVNYKLVKISSPCITSLPKNNTIFGFSQTHIRMLSTLFLCSVWLSRKIANNVHDILLIEENIPH